MGKHRRPRRDPSSPYRSGLEDAVVASLQARGVPFLYEAKVLEYVVPETKHRYTPDFVITTASGHTLYVETKGLWELADRKKMKLVCEQNPDLDIRMVFQRASNKIRKGSQTTYATWCERHLAIPWAEGDIPTAWIEE